MDRAREYVMDFLDRYENSRKYVQVTIHKFLYLKLVITQVDKQYEAKLFSHGAEQQTYWMVMDERRPLVARMMKAGMKQSIIAKCLKLHPGTIHNDVAYLRDNTTLLDGVKLRPRKQEQATVRRIVRTNHEGLTLQ
jgi:hypothetical protein